MASYKTSLRNSNMSNIVTALTSTSRLIFYSGSAPANTASPTGTPLATFTLPSTAGTVSAGVLTFGSISNVMGSNSGTPGYFRMISGTTDDGTVTIIQGSAGVGGGEFSFSSTIASGGTVSITSITIQEGNP